MVNKKENALNDLMILNSNKFLYSHNIALNFRHDRKSGHNSVSFFGGNYPEETLCTICNDRVLFPDYFLIVHRSAGKEDFHGE